MADSMLNQSQTQARDLAEQMGQRLKVTEAMLAEAVKARERLVADNESAVEGLLATVGSKDQLLKVRLLIGETFSLAAIGTTTLIRRRVFSDKKHATRSVPSSGPIFR